MSIMAFPLTNLKAIVSKHTPQQEIMHFSVDKSQVGTWLESVHNRTMLDMHDGEEEMYFLVLD